MESLEHVLKKYTLGPHVQDYSWEQHIELEKHFKMDAYPDRNTCTTLGARVNLSTDLVAPWFDKRRAVQVLLSPLVQGVRWHPRMQRRLGSHSSRLSMAMYQYQAMRRRRGRDARPEDQSCPFCSQWGFPESQAGAALPPALEAFQRLSVSAPAEQEDGDAVVQEDESGPPGAF